MNNAKSPFECPICGSGRVKGLFEVGAYHIMLCRDCGGGFIWPMPRASELPGIYGERYGDDYLKGVMHEASFAEARFQDVIAAIGRWHPATLGRQRRRVLDVGCGSGRFLALLRDAGWEVHGVEISSGLSKYARELGLDVLQGEFLAADLPIGAFDLVCMFHVVEHFIDPAAALRKVHDLLAPGGVLFVETPNWSSIGALVRGPRWSHFIPPEHVTYLGPKSVSRLAESCGLSTVMCRTITPPVIQSLQALPGVARTIGILLYDLASLLGRGPSLQYMGRRP